MNRAKQIRERYSYNPKTGVFRWKKNRCKKYIGAVAGTLHKKTGYWFLALEGTKKTKGHIAAWVLYYGRYPKHDIDHKNRNKADNRINNLRPSNKSRNGANRGAQKNNTSGFKGVYWSAAAGKWMAQIQLKRRAKYLGLHRTKKAAARAYDVEAVALFGTHAKTNFQVAA